MHDPLYRMATAASTAKAHKSRGGRQSVASSAGQNQSGADGSDLPEGLGNLDAERTLLRVKQKLEGRETGA